MATMTHGQGEQAEALVTPARIAAVIILLAGTVYWMLMGNARYGELNLVISIGIVWTPAILVLMKERVLPRAANWLVEVATLAIGVVTFSEYMSNLESRAVQLESWHVIVVPLLLLAYWLMRNGSFTRRPR